MKKFEEKEKKLPPQEHPPVPSVPNRAYTEMRKGNTDPPQNKAQGTPKASKED